MDAHFQWVVNVPENNWPDDDHTPGNTRRASWYLSDSPVRERWKQDWVFRCRLRLYPGGWAVHAAKGVCMFLQTLRWIGGYCSAPVTVHRRYCPVVLHIGNVHRNVGSIPAYVLFFCEWAERWYKWDLFWAAIYIIHPECRFPRVFSGKKRESLRRAIIFPVRALFYGSVRHLKSGGKYAGDSVLWLINRCVQLQNWFVRTGRSFAGFRSASGYGRGVRAGHAFVYRLCRACYHRCGRQSTKYQTILLSPYFPCMQR